MQRTQRKSSGRQQKKQEAKKRSVEIAELPEQTTKTTSQPLVSSQPVVVYPRLQRLRWPIMVLMYLVLSALVLFASLIPLFNIVKIDDGLRDLMVYYVGNKVENKFDDRLEIILVSKSQQPEGPWGKIDPTHRPFYGEMLQALSAAGAKMVIFDMEFAKEAKDKQIDQKFAETIAQLKNTEVFVAADLGKRDFQPTFAPLLEPVLKDRWGIWDGATAKGGSTVRWVRLGIQNPGQEEVVGERTITPSLALHVVMEERYPGRNIKPFYNPSLQQVVLREGGPDGPAVNRFPANDSLDFLVDLIAEDEMGRHPSFYEVYSQRGNPNYMRNFKDRAVIIGYEEDDQVSAGDSGAKRFGADIQASAMSNLLQDAYIHPLSLPYHYLVIALMIVIGGILRLRFCNLMSYKLPLKIPGIIDWKPQVPTVLIVLSVLYFFIALIAYLSTRTLLGVSYHLTALFLAYLLTSAVCLRLGFK